MKLLITALVFSALILVPALPGPMAQPVEATADPHQKLFEAKCQKCHSLEKVKEAHLTREMIKPTVDRMKSKPGADISQKDADSLTAYLSTYLMAPPDPPVVPAPIQ